MEVSPCTRVVLKSVYEKGSSVHYRMYSSIYYKIILKTYAYIIIYSCTNFLLMNELFT